MFKATILMDVSMQEDTTKPLDVRAKYVTKRAGEVITCDESFRKRFTELRNYIKIEDDKIQNPNTVNDINDVNEEIVEEIVEEEEEVQEDEPVKPRARKK